MDAATGSLNSGARSERPMARTTRHPRKPAVAAKLPSPPREPRERPDPEREPGRGPPCPCRLSGLRPDPADRADGARPPSPDRARRASPGRLERGRDSVLAHGRLSALSRRPLVPLMSAFRPGARSALLHLPPDRVGPGSGRTAQRFSDPARDCRRGPTVARAGGHRRIVEELAKSETAVEVIDDLANPDRPGWLRPTRRPPAG